MKATAKEIYENHSECKETTSWRKVQGDWYWWGLKVKLIAKSTDRYLIFWFSGPNDHGESRIPADSVFYRREENVRN